MYMGKPYWKFFFDNAVSYKTFELKMTDYVILITTLIPSIEINQVAYSNFASLCLPC